MRFNRPAPLLTAALFTAALSSSAPLDLSNSPLSPGFAELANTPPSSPSFAERRESLSFPRFAESFGSSSSPGVTEREESSTSTGVTDGVVARAPAADDIDLVEGRWWKHERPIKCTNLIVIYARGTLEQGELGQFVGPFYKKHIEEQIGRSASFSIYGVPSPAYPAVIPGFLIGGSPTGSAAMAKMAAYAVQACPASKVVLSGYSQGGQVVHNACKALPPSITSRVGAVIFGDPDQGDPVLGVPRGSVRVFCHPDDDICDHGYGILVSHLTYGLIDAKAAAAFTVAGTPTGAIVPAIVPAAIVPAVVAVSPRSAAPVAATRAPASIVGTPEGSRYVKRQENDGSQDVSSLYTAAMEIPDSFLVSNINDPQRVPTANGPPPTEASFRQMALPRLKRDNEVQDDRAPPVQVIAEKKTLAHRHEVRAKDGHAGLQDTLDPLDPQAVAEVVDPEKRDSGHDHASRDYYAGPQDVPNPFNLPDIFEALNPEKRDPDHHHASRGYYAGPQDVPNPFNLPNIFEALNPEKRKEKRFES